MNKLSTYENYHFIIKVFNKKREQIAFKIWDNMTFEFRMRWNWYFRYRIALFQVQNPRCEIQISWGNNPDKKQMMKYLKNTIRKEIYYFYNIKKRTKNQLTIK